MLKYTKSIIIQTFLNGALSILFKIFSGILSKNDPKPHSMKTLT